MRSNQLDGGLLDPSAVAGASALALAEAVQSIARELTGREAPDSGAAALELAETLLNGLDVLERGLATLVRKVDAERAFDDVGASSTASWLRTRGGMKEGRAHERVRLARQLPRLPEASKRLADGDLSLGYAQAIADSVARLGEQDVPVGERILLGLAERGDTVNQVARKGAEITDLINEARGKEKEPEDSRRGFERSWLTKSRSSDGGSWMRGWLNAEDTAIFEQIIGPLAKPKARGDDRDLGQRTADALMSVISEGNRNAGVTVIIDLAAFTQATGDDGTQTGPFTGSSEADRPGTPGEDAAPDSLFDLSDLRGLFDPNDLGDLGDQRVPDDPPDEHPTEPPGGEQLTSMTTGPRGDGRERLRERIRDVVRGKPRAAARLLDGTPISPERARQIALIAGVNPLIIGRSGHPLHLGYRQRFATPAQRKALLALYETCVVHGCHIPAHLSEIHHLEGGWKLLTPTDVDKLAPACGYHNRWIETHPQRVKESRDQLGRAVIRLLPPWENTP